MTREIELAKQYGISYGGVVEHGMRCMDWELQNFADALVAAERERCAKWVAARRDAFIAEYGMEAADMIEGLRAAIQHAILDLVAIDDETAQIQCIELAAVLKA